MAPYATLLNLLVGVGRYYGDVFGGYGVGLCGGGVSGMNASMADRSMNPVDVVLRDQTHRIVNFDHLLVFTFMPI